MGEFYSYGPNLTVKEVRGVPCYACGETGVGGLLLASPRRGPEGVTRLCEAHAGLAFRHWARLDRLHRENRVGYYNVGS